MFAAIKGVNNINAFSRSSQRIDLIRWSKDRSPLFGPGCTTYIGDDKLREISIEFKDKDNYYHNGKLAGNPKLTLISKKVGVSPTTIAKYYRDNHQEFVDYKHNDDSFTEEYRHNPDWADVDVDRYVSNVADKRYIRYGYYIEPDMYDMDVPDKYVDIFMDSNSYNNYGTLKYEEIGERFGVCGSLIALYYNRWASNIDELYDDEF